VPSPTGQAKVHPLIEHPLSKGGADRAKKARILKLSPVACVPGQSHLNLGSRQGN